MISTTSISTNGSGCSAPCSRYSSTSIAGAIRLSTGPGAYALHQFDRQQVLRYTERDRKQAYRRVFGYTSTPGLCRARSPTPRSILSSFSSSPSVAEFFRDKRVSEVIRPRATDPSFGSIAVVRRAGLDLRNNLEQDFLRARQCAPFSTACNWLREAF